MSKAMSDLNYQGTIALFRNGKLDTLEFYHALNEGLEQERLVSLNSPLREIIRNSKHVKCTFLDTKQTIVDHRPSRRSFLMDLPENLEKAEQFYTFTLAENAIIAMRPARVIEIKPLDNYRYARKIWVDEKNFLPLKFELTSEQGAILEQMIFTGLEVFESLPRTEIQLESTQQVRHIHQLESLDFNLSSFITRQIPVGFEKMFFTHQRLRANDNPVEHLLLSDGFSSVSVYLEKIIKKQFAGHQSAGSVNSYFRQLNGYQLTIMGEVPNHTLKYIADGIHLKKPDEISTIH
jgi:sigma-E factor negative regulatory protein RseB